jgi:hypothetical protein
MFMPEHGSSSSPSSASASASGDEEEEHTGAADADEAAPAEGDEDEDAAEEAARASGGARDAAASDADEEEASDGGGAAHGGAAAPASDAEEGGSEGKSSEEEESDDDSILCSMCGVGGDASLLVLCDGCDAGAHTYCMTPPLKAVPKGAWFCQRCSAKAKGAPAASAAPQVKRPLPVRKPPAARPPPPVKAPAAGKAPAAAAAAAAGAAAAVASPAKLAAPVAAAAAAVSPAKAATAVAGAAPAAAPSPAAAPPAPAPPLPPPPPPPPKPAVSSGVGAILANACWKQPVAANVYSGLCSMVAALPAGGVVWRGALTFPGAGGSAAAEGAGAAAAGSASDARPVACAVVARPPATGNPGAGAEGISRAVAAGGLLPECLQLTWAPADSLPAAWEPLAMLRMSSSSPADEPGLQALETALEAHVRAPCAACCMLRVARAARACGCVRAHALTARPLHRVRFRFHLWAQAEAGTFVCVLPHATLFLRAQSCLPLPLRPSTARLVSAGGPRLPAVVYGLLLEPPPVGLSPLPSRDARPSRAILRHLAPRPPAAPPLPPAAAPPGEALRGLRFTLLGFAAGDPAASVAVDAALREGAHYESAPTPRNVDLVVIEPSLVHRLPDFALRLSDFAAVRGVRFVAGARHVEACAAQRRVLDPRLDTRAELFPDGAIVVSGACLGCACCAPCTHIHVFLTRLLALPFLQTQTRWRRVTAPRATCCCCCAAARPPPTPPPPPARGWRPESSWRSRPRGRGGWRSTRWSGRRCRTSPKRYARARACATDCATHCASRTPCMPRHAPQQAVGLSTTCAGDAVSAIEEAMAGPGPGVGTTGVPRAVLFQPEEVSRSTVVDPPQARTRPPAHTRASSALSFRSIPLVGSLLR